MTLDRAPWSPLSQDLARRLQDDIHAGRWPVGERIASQRELSAQLGISRATLREALLTLETLGLLRTEPGRGTFVAEARPRAPVWNFAGGVSEAAVFEARLAIEPAIAAAAARVRMSVADLRAEAERMARAWAEGDLVSHVEADLAFHRRLAEGCGNPVLTEMYRGSAQLFHESQRRPVGSTGPARMEQSLAEHRGIADAVATGDRDAAWRIMAAHVARTAEGAGVRVPSHVLAAG